jgi:hypothetical protein
MKTENEKQDGEIKFFRTNEMTTLVHPSDELIKMWRDMFNHQKNNYDCPSLSANEERLYDLLTIRLINEISFISISTKELEK